jgi:acetolactate synthase-1/2/3 large subunit
VKNTNDGGEAILEALRNLSIDYVFSSPGSEWPPLWEALTRQKIEGRQGPHYLDCGHETLAVAMATGYTQVTGRMQAVVLHAGSGLLQGSMAINGANLSEVPMMIMSGESLTYGERPDFDPGRQWYSSLGIVGGANRLVEPIVKWANQATSPETLYHSVIRMGEMAQRVPRGPTYLAVPMETMVHEWTRPAKPPTVPRAPKVKALPEDVQKVASLIAQARCPVIIAESAGRDPDAFAALVALADRLSIPVVEGRAAAYANFPKSHPMYLGSDLAPLMREMDLALLVESRVPWYPPSKSPPNATVVVIGENPLKGHMVYQNLAADHYLEGDLALSLRLLLEALERLMPPERTAERRARWEERHAKIMSDLRNAEAGQAPAAGTTVQAVCKALRELVPDDPVYVDETIVHSPGLRAHLHWDRAQSFFRPTGGLGQGLPLSLGIKLAAPERFVTLLIGDGSFLYNPVLTSLALARKQRLPILIVILDNGKYEVMRRTHLQFYPSGASAGANDFLGVEVDGMDYAALAALVGGYGRRVEDAASLAPALKAAIAAVQSGRTAIVSVLMNE